MRSGKGLSNPSARCSARFLDFDKDGLSDLPVIMRDKSFNLLEGADFDFRFHRVLGACSTSVWLDLHWRSPETSRMPRTMGPRYICACRSPESGRTERTSLPRYSGFTADLGRMMSDSSFWAASSAITLNDPLAWVRSNAMGPPVQQSECANRIQLGYPPALPGWQQESDISSSLLYPCPFPSCFLVAK